MKCVSLISLGCPKNTVDSENLLKGLLRRGVRVSDDPGEADILAVNTCGFIEDAKRESIDEILRLAALKKNGKKLVVLGCLAQRYREELRREMPEIDALFGVGEEERIIEYCADGNENPPQPPFSKGGSSNPPLEKGDLGGFDNVGIVSFPQSRHGGSVGNLSENEERFRTSRNDKYNNDAVIAASHYRYLKISEGCGRRCSFCVIPSIKGPHRSRRPDEILEEARSAVEGGAKELILVAQDITAYGKDIKGGAGLASLLRNMASIGGDFWIRLLYLHPAGVDDGLLDAVASEEKVVKYIDMPLQHTEDRILKAMQRAGGTRKGYLKLIHKIRRAVPGVALRTAFIVGFPGEGEEDFNALLDFVEEARFDRLGAFMYSREEGTPAASLTGQVPEEVKKRRWEDLMRLQADISREKNLSLVGRVTRALIDEANAGEAVARIYSQAPEIDGHTIVKGRGLRAGEFVDVRIAAASDYDLEGVPA